MFKRFISRRDFLAGLLKSTVSTASMSALSPFMKPFWSVAPRSNPRVRVPNPFVNLAGQPILVCVNGTDFQTMLAAGLAELSGLGRLIDDNQDVLIKPNLVISYEQYPTISDIDSIVATITAVQAVSSGLIKVGDTGGYDPSVIYQQLGLEPVITQAGAELVAFSDTCYVMRHAWPDFVVYSDVYDAPIIINFCNLKRHESAFLTCAIKNHVGTVSGPRTSDTRAYLHGFDSLTDEFLQAIAETAGVINPELTIVDARSIMAVTGPYRSVGGVVRELNKIVICGDIVAAEAYCAQLMDEIDETFDPAWIQPILERAEELGLGTADLTEVEIIEINSALSVASENQITYQNAAAPRRFELNQNHPNPFNQSTTISFSLPEASKVKLAVYDVSGRRVTELVNGWRNVGIHKVTFDGSGLASGIYVYNLTAGSFNAIGKMVLMK
jgi:uncharacterized protein (DUF362 family)